MVHAQSECELAPAWQWGDLARGRVHLLTTARAVKTLINKAGLLLRVSYVTYQSLSLDVNVIFFLEYPDLGSLQMAISLKISVSHITLRTTKLFPLRVIQQARTEDNYRYGKQDVNMNPLVRSNFFKYIPFQLSLAKSF